MTQKGKYPACGRYRAPALLRAAAMLITASLLTNQSADAGAIPPTLSDLQITTLVAAETTVGDLSMVTFLNDQMVPAGPVGEWRGVINPTNWSLVFSGTLAGKPLSIQQSGILTGPATAPFDRATWTNTGFFGSDTIIGSGTFTFDPGWLETIFVGAVDATIGGIQAVECVATVGTGCIAGVVASSVGLKVIDKIVDDAAKTNASITISPNGISSDVTAIFQTSESAQTQLSLSESGTLNSDGSITLIAQSPIPEPSSFVLLCAAVIVLSLVRLLFDRSPQENRGGRTAIGDDGHVHEGLGPQLLTQFVSRAVPKACRPSREEPNYV
jgi:hypothetical protein